MTIHAARRPAVWICISVIAALAGGLYWNSRPNELELQLRGVWRSQLVGADDFQLLTFSPDGRLLSYDSVSETFRDGDESWSVEGDQVRIDVLLAFTKTQRLLLPLYRIVNSAAAQQGVRYYDIIWNGDNECMLTSAHPNETLTIKLFREADLDPTIWDESGLPLRQVSPAGSLR